MEKKLNRYYEYNEMTLDVVFEYKPQREGTTGELLPASVSIDTIKYMGVDVTDLLANAAKDKFYQDMEKHFLENEK